VAPSLKVTVPVGVPVPVTVAVNVTDWPKTDGFTLETSTVVDAVEFTTCVRMLEVLPLSFASPPYTAVMGCEPADNVVVEKVAVAVLPEPLSVPVPMDTPLSSKVTDPPGVIEPVVVTVAVNVTDAPDVEGLRLDTTPVVVACSTCCVSAAEALPSLFASPP
jgi:hypothetical protein